MLCCFALFVCLTLLASFFLPSHLSLKTCTFYLEHQLIVLSKDGDRAKHEFEQLQVEVGPLYVLCRENKTNHFSLYIHPQTPETTPTAPPTSHLLHVAEQEVEQDAGEGWGGGGVGEEGVGDDLERIV